MNFIANILKTNKDRILFTDTATYYYLLLNQNFVINQIH